MRKYLLGWRAGLSAVAFATALSLSAARGQESDPSNPTGQLWTGASQQTAAQNVAYSAAPDLEKRVADLEAALKKADDKAKADKTKAAGRPSVEVGGRIFYDTNFFAQDAANAAALGNAKNGDGFRAARLHAKGKAFDVIEYQIEWDFVSNMTDADAPAGRPIGNGITAKDTYIAVTELPYVGNIKAGHFKEPICLEELTSDNFTTLMERNMSDNALIPARRFGVQAYDWADDKMGTWAIGAFTTARADFRPVGDNNDDLAQSVTARVTRLLWWDEATDGRGLWHTGLGYSYRNVAQNAGVSGQGSPVTFSSRNDNYFGVTAVTSGALPLANYQLFDVETAMVYGPLSVQGEFVVAPVNPINGALATSTFTGGYVMLSFFLTGENRNYKRETGVFDRIKPYENFFRVRTEDGNVETGLGAWELAYRYDYVDVGNNIIAQPAAGQLNIGQAHTFGVNWYLNPYTRMMFDYVHALGHRGVNDAGFLDAFMTRFQIDF